MITSSLQSDRKFPAGRRSTLASDLNSPTSPLQHLTSVRQALEQKFGQDTFSHFSSVRWLRKLMASACVVGRFEIGQVEASSWWVLPAAILRRSFKFLILFLLSEEWLSLSVVGELWRTSDRGKRYTCFASRCVRLLLSTRRLSHSKGEKMKETWYGKLKERRKLTVLIRKGIGCREQ